ncbi:hypothetical protein HNR34_002322 [Geobacillus subterraneus]
MLSLLALTLGSGGFLQSKMIKGKRKKEETTGKAK